MTTPEPDLSAALDALIEQAVAAARDAIHENVCTKFRSHDSARDLYSARAAVDAALPFIRRWERQRFAADLPKQIAAMLKELHKNPSRKEDPDG